MTKTNVLMMGEFREHQELRRTQETYGRYLSTLENNQLEAEINFLLEEFSQDSYGRDFSSKVKLVQKELVSRADANWKGKIEMINQDTMRLL